MTTHAVPLGVITIRPEIVLITAVAAGAALGAVHAEADHLSPTDAITADLHLTGAHTAAPLAASVTTAAPAPLEAGDLAKGARLAAHGAAVDAAVDRFESHLGSTRYEDYCERAVENAYGTQGHYASAIDDWHARDQHSDWRHAPRGALVFYDTSADGHVALSLGDGRVVSSSAHHQVGVVPVDYFQHPLGWAPSPY